MQRGYEKHVSKVTKSGRFYAARRTVCVAVSCAAFLLSTERAEADPIRPDFVAGEPAAEAALFALSAGAITLYALPQNKTTWRAGFAQPFDPDIGLVSDIVSGPIGTFLQIGLGYPLEALYLHNGDVRHPGVEAAYAFIVDSEATLVTASAIALIKKLTGRCRPRAQGDHTCTEYDAFPSGHVAGPAGLAGARLVRLIETESDGQGYRALSYALAESCATAATFLRVAAAAHSVEDVIVGDLLGHAIGAGIALMHPRKRLEPESEPIGTAPAAARRPATELMFFHYSTRF